MARCSLLPHPMDSQACHSHLQPKTLMLSFYIPEVSVRVGRRFGKQMPNKFTSEFYEVSPIN